MGEVNNVVINEPYGFIYITTNLINGKRYLGQRMFDKHHCWKYYLGSGAIFHKALKKYGKHNFSRQIVYICYSPEELNCAEYELSMFLNVVESSDFYNLVYGGKALYGENNPMYGVSPQERMSEKTYIKWKNKQQINNSGSGNPMFGQHHSDFTKEKIRKKQTWQTGENNPFYGKKHTDEIKEKLRQINIGKKASKETKALFSKQRTGKSNPKSHPLYCYELNEYFWGSVDVKNKYPQIAHQNINIACKDPSRTCGVHPVTKERLHWCYITKDEYNNYIKTLEE